MQPTEHMKRSEEELIAHIKDSLSAHEEAYVPGTWEKFNRQGRQRPPLVLWIGRLSAAAAVLLMATGLFLWINSIPDKKAVEVTEMGAGNPVVVSPNAHVQEAENAPVIARNVTPINNSKQDAIKGTAAAGPALSVAPQEGSVSSQADNPPLQPAVTQALIAQTIPVTIIANADPTVAIKTPVAGNNATVEDKKPSLLEFLDKESQLMAANQLATVKAVQQKWGMSVMVAPSFGNTKKLNMGYGLGMAYAVSDKISFSSGISYNEIEASRDVAVSENFGLVAQSSRDLESTNAKVIGLDIPLEIRYHVNKNLYANVGVSAFAVLNQARNNTYLEGRLVQQAALAPNGNYEEQTFLVKERVVEPAPVESDIKDGRYLGFYNFSFGYKQKISKTNAISIEPFMKVPMKEVTKENLRLMGTGVRLKFDF